MPTIDVRARLDDLPAHEVKPGLDRIETLLDALDSPHHDYPTAVVAGTNGKGSVAAMLTSICVAAGIRVGTYTSPHLTDLEERFRVDGFSVSGHALRLYLAEVFEVVDELLADGALQEHPSYFEVLTAAALRYFSEARVSLAVLEVGLGGRWDATNVTRPRVSVLTRIAVDHSAWLGEELEEIAAEKAGIIPRGGVVVCGAQEPAAAAVIRRRAEAMDAHLWPADECLLVPRGLDDRLRVTFDYVGRLRTYAGLELALPGRHQVENARCTILAAEALDRRRMRISADAVWAGLRNAECPGRCEWIDGEPPLLLDVAHNPSATAALAAYLDELRERDAFERVHLVVGLLEDKDRAGILAPLFERSETAALTRPDSTRAVPPGDLAKVASVPRHRVLEDPGEALEWAREQAAPGDLVCVTGSHYLVGPLRDLVA